MVISNPSAKPPRCVLKLIKIRHRETWAFAAGTLDQHLRFINCMQRLSCASRA